jgi:predicted RNA-binding Zn ribbon-like protein
VDVVRYAEEAAGLVNADLPDAAALRAHLTRREWLHDRVTDRDAAALRRLQPRLREVFEASDTGLVDDVVAGLNALLEQHPVAPQITDHDGRLHLHVATRTASVADLLLGEALLGLSTLVCDLGPTRLGVCAARDCEAVFVDTSPNASRRYCSDRCSSRANVAAYRARQRAGAGA